jgi:hypothetical protein
MAGGTGENDVIQAKRINSQVPSFETISTIKKPSLLMFIFQEM